MARVHADGASSPLTKHRWRVALCCVAAAGVLGGCADASPFRAARPTQSASLEPAPTITSSARFNPTTSMPSSTPEQSSPFHPIVSDGDQVRIVGRLMEWVDDPIVCTDLIWATSRPPIPGCGSQIIPLRGIDVRSVPGSDENLPRSWVTRTVTLTGTWRGGSIDVTDWTVGGEPLDPHADMAVPCDPPDDGWTHESPTEADGRKLDREIEGSPDRYVGHWYVRSETAPLVVVVAMVPGDASVASRLKRIYPYNLCVIDLSIAATDLRNIERQLGYHDGGLTLIPTHSGLLLRVTVLDRALVDALGGAWNELSVAPHATKVR